jgi:hypothetical protein
MLRLVGYVGGTAMFLALGIAKVPGYIYYLICASLCIAIVLFLVLFRVMAKHFHGFWRVWSNRLQTWISHAVMCLSRYTQLPDYQPRRSLPLQPGETSVSITDNPHRSIWWGLFELLVCFVLTAFSPALLAFVFFCYGEAIYYECQHQSLRKEHKEKREEIIARQSARMSLEVPLNEVNESEL